jgi:hypothetical protein
MTSEAFFSGFNCCRKLVLLIFENEWRFLFLLAKCPALKMVWNVTLKHYRIIPGEHFYHTFWKIWMEMKFEVLDTPHWNSEDSLYKPICVLIQTLLPFLSPSRSSLQCFIIYHYQYFPHQFSSSKNHNVDN